MCKPYLTSRDYVIPYAQPYYDSYAAPYVDAVRPYGQKIESQYLTPMVTFGKRTYQSYGAPRVDQAQAFGVTQWQKNVVPQWEVARQHAKVTYDASIAPHVNKVSDAASPYYSTVKDAGLQTYNDRVLPAYTKAKPYALQAYSTGHGFAVNTALPSGKLAWSSAVVFFDRTLWPKLRVLYGENVEPQLVRIGERLGRYRDGKKLKAAVEEVDHDNSVSVTSSSSYSVTSSVVADPTPSSSGITSPSSSASTEAAATPSSGTSDENVQEKVNNDLRTWQTKFAKAADKGTQELEERVKEITDRQSDSQASGVGEALLIQLEERASHQIEGLKSKIKTIVQGLPDDPEAADLETAETELLETIRVGGSEIRTKAQAVRSWRQKYDQETDSLVNAALDSTLEILDNIRDLGLQEIGMRWAWMEGVTYKDWAKYHELKKVFEDWRGEVEIIATEHAGLQKAKAAGEDVEARGMAVATEAARELGRLKDVGRWKIRARDDSDDFSTREMPAAAVSAAQKVKDKVEAVSESFNGQSQGTVDSVVSQATEGAANAASSASSIVAGTETDLTEQAATAASSKVQQASSKASTAIYGTPEPAVEKAASAAQSEASELSKAASKKVMGTQQPIAESVISEASTLAEHGASSIASAASSASSEAPKKVWGGAMAQKVAGHQPILDDIISDDEGDSYSEKLQSVVSEAGDRYADVTRAVSEALLGGTKTQGTVESVTSVANEQYAQAIAAASKALYGEPQGTMESAASVVSGKYDDAVSA